jgi:hypothetical protein
MYFEMLTNCDDMRVEGRKIYRSRSRFEMFILSTDSFIQIGRYYDALPINMILKVDAIFVLQGNHVGDAGASAIASNPLHSPNPLAAMYLVIR